MFLHCFFFVFFFVNFCSYSLGLPSIIDYFVNIIFYQIFRISFIQFILLISPRNTVPDFQSALNRGIPLHLPNFWNHRTVFVGWSTIHLILELSVLRRLVTYFTASVLSALQYSSKGILWIGSLFDQIENVLILGLRGIIFDSLNRLNVIYILIWHHLLLSVLGATAASSSSFHLYLWLRVIAIVSL